MIAIVNHERLLDADTLRPEDRAMLREIFRAMVGAAAGEQTGIRARKLIRAYYRDGERADRTPRSLVYFHLGFALGDAA